MTSVWFTRHASISGQLTRDRVTTNETVGKISEQTLPAMSMPPEFWNAERLERAMLDEAATHGASQRDLDFLRTEFPQGPGAIIIAMYSAMRTQALKSAIFHPKNESN